jgi:hypothetical protein
MEHCTGTGYGAALGRDWVWRCTGYGAARLAAAPGVWEPGPGTTSNGAWSPGPGAMAHGAAGSEPVGGGKREEGGGGRRRTWLWRLAAPGRDGGWAQASGRDGVWRLGAMAFGSWARWRLAAGRRPIKAHERYAHRTSLERIKRPERAFRRLNAD